MARGRSESLNQAQSYSISLKSSVRSYRKRWARVPSAFRGFSGKSEAHHILAEASALYAYAPMKIEYAIDRFAMEVRRQLDVLDRRLAENQYIVGDTYTIADMAIFPWYAGLAKGWIYGAGEFLSVQEYKHLQRWADVLLERSAVQRGRMVNRLSGEPSSQLHERHDASDFDTKTQDKLAATR